MSQTLLLTGALDAVSAGLAQHAARSWSEACGIDVVRCMFWPGSDLTLVNPAPANLKVFIGELTHGPDLTDLYTGARNPVQIHFVSAPHAQVPLMWYRENLRAVPVLLEQAIKTGVQRFVLVLPAAPHKRARGPFVRWVSAISGQLPARHLQEQALFELRLNSTRIQTLVMYIPGVYGPGVPLVTELLERLSVGGSVPVPNMSGPSLEFVYTEDLYRQVMESVQAGGEPVETVLTCASVQLFEPAELVSTVARLMRTEFGIAVPEQPRIVRVPLAAMAMGGVLLRWLWRAGRHSWTLEWLVRAGAACGSCSGAHSRPGASPPESVLRSIIASWVEQHPRRAGPLLMRAQPSK